jgi:ketosteroid isomerase-like protein
MAAAVSSEEVRSEVQRFWDILTGRSKGTLEELYSPSAIVFTGKARSSEPGRLTAVRRMRQLGSAGFTASAELDPIEVQIAGPDTAIASYAYRFHSSRTRKDGGKEQRETLFGRSTQIFQRDDRGILRIVHEHLSSAAPPKIEKGETEKV